ncbi:glycosyltransferase [Adhaeribacter pallidiroseus]|uniref:Diglucosyl diacylglycerol synthase (1,2-linking) n=1 Tax=Adhaeribacter pallidiroseus TaxID=2072847 RepID=A0A369QV87_9BACT|nr:glycosyltransferase [Adhaeribacter pallidiroseus]RDC66098.1 Diglucosyl diacylglycerol synthase (1,2-linking) [Adhaeribacter pallidiroseus]
MLDPYFQKAAGRKLKALRNWAYWKLIEGNVVNDADGLLFTCEEERILAREPFRPYRPKRELVVGLGVEAPPLFTPTMRQSFLAKCPELQNQPYILFLSRIHEKKGVDLLIAAYAKLIYNTVKVNTGKFSVGSMPVDETVIPEITRKNLPKLVIAGPGLETPYGVQMQKLVSESAELKNAVFFPGMLTGDAKWGAFYGCEAFILPSHQENFGIAVVEALACGKPVLISNQVNIWREIEKEGAGLIATDTPAGTFTLLNVWQQLSEDEKLKIIMKTKITYEKHFEIISIVDRLLKAVSY